MTIKAKIKVISDGSAEVKVLIKHPMETGLRKDRKTGKVIPAHYIKTVACEWQGKQIMTAYWGWAISKNPYLSFRMNGPASGDTVKVSWVDNMDESDSKEFKVR